MHRRLLIISLLILVTQIAYSQSKKILIKSENLSESNYLQADDFYLTHYLYIDLFLRENLFPEVSPEEVSTILNALKTYVSVDTDLDIEIKKPGKSKYLIRFSIFKKEDGTELLIAFTNWSAKNKHFEKDIHIENDSYTRWYFLNGTKMTYRKDMSLEKEYSSLSKPDLANAYLFDELFENDTEIKSTIDNILTDNALPITDTITTHLILLKYYISQRDTYSINKQTDYLESLFKNNTSGANLRGLEMAFNATKFQIELMK